MRNNKGFTLMELIAAIFIGGMVTAALVLVWKTASLQTSQGQRHTIIRNQISNFQRQLYRDFYETDIITWPEAGRTSDTLLLVGLKKAKQISTTQFECFYNARPKGPTIVYAYCLDGNQVIRRYEEPVTPSGGTQVKKISDFTSSYLSKCNNEGREVLTNFSHPNGHAATLEDDGYRFTFQGTVQRTFQNRANTTPIYIEINETLLKQGGN